MQLAALRSALGTEPAIARAFAPRIAVLLVDRDGVVRLRVDAVLHEEVQQRVAVRRIPASR